MKSLKNTISSFIILSIATVSILVGVIAMLNFYDMKINSVEHTQKQFLKQVDFEAIKLIQKIESVASHIARKNNITNESLKDIVTLNSDISSIFILNKEGILKKFYSKQVDNIYVGFDYSNKDFFKDIKNSSFSWSNVFLSSVNNTPSISYSLKYENRVIVIELKLDELTQFVTRFKNSDGTHMIRMVDKNGVFIFNPDSKKLVNQRFNIKNSLVYDELIKDKAMFKIRSFYNIKRDVKNIGMYTKVKKTGWIIIIRENHETLIRSLEKILILIFLIIVLFILFALYFVFKIFNKIFFELDYLQQRAKDISNGDYTKTLKQSKFKEVSGLINSFDKMKKQIKKREKNLKASRDSFEYLLNSTMEAIVLHDTKKIYDVNDVTLKLLKIKNKEDILGKSPFVYISDSSYEKVAKNFQKNTTPYELELKDTKGETFTALGQGKFIVLNQKRLKISCFIDITELKNKDKLISQQAKMVSMGEMIGNIAHQWRQPLSSISTAASGLKVEKELEILDDESLENALNMIIKNTQYLSKTIDDFRNFFKVDKQIEIIDVNDVMKKALKLLESSFKDHGIEVVMNFSKNMTINGFSNELAQAFINIINNSKDALKLNNIERKLIVIDTYISKNSVVIIIKDNAGGISKEVKPKIFEPYFTTKHQTQGTGIGLYMTHQIIVDHMNGNIQVENVKFKYEKIEYKGCEFKISFDYIENT